MLVSGLFVLWHYTGPSNTQQAHLWHTSLHPPLGPGCNVNFSTAVLRECTAETRSTADSDNVNVGLVGL